MAALNPSTDPSAEPQPASSAGLRENGLSVTDLRTGNTGADRSTGAGAVSNSASKAFVRSIGQFVYENAIELSVVTSPTFKNMIRGFLKTGGPTYDLSSIVELKECNVLEEEMKTILTYVNRIRTTWGVTGCSILLDGWTDQSGRDLIHVLVDCPAGPIYLRSADVSPSKGDDALLLLLEYVIAEVGVKNIIHIVAHTTSPSLDVVRQKLAERYGSIFWTVSGTRCLSMMLEEFADESHLIKPTLNISKRITRFIYNNYDALELLKGYIDGEDLVRSSKIKVATSFLTLARLLFRREKLTQMCNSSEWLASRWGSSEEGIEVARLVSNDNFWHSVVTVVRLSIPLVNAIALINGKGEQSFGFIYETMDQIKDTIRLVLGENIPTYWACWQTVDIIWNGVLHSTLHDSALFLSPTYVFPNDFEFDPEIIGGMLAIVWMTNDRCGQAEMCRELDFYRNNRAGFGTEVQEIHDISPAAWWARHGGPYFLLQKVAIRLHSQKCNGADCYELRRDVAGKLLSDKRMNPIEQKKMIYFIFLHYNMNLKHSRDRPNFNILADEIDPTDDWIVDETHQADVVAPVVFESRPRLGSGSESGSGSGSSSAPLGKNPKRKK